jgi:hypothetical protein
LKLKKKIVKSKAAAWAKARPSQAIVDTWAWPGNFESLRPGQSRGFQAKPGRNSTKPNVQAREIEREIERWGSDAEALAERAQLSIRQFNPQQLEIYNAVTSAVREDRQLLAFVDGKGGRGKTVITFDPLAVFSYLLLPLLLQPRIMKAVELCTPCSRYA